MVKLLMKVDVTATKLFFHKKTENVELTVLSLIKNRKIQILKNTPVEMWTHGSICSLPPIKVKALKFLCPPPPHSLFIFLYLCYFLFFIL